MRSARLLSILILLQLRARLTAGALAQEFGVSVRTIYRDVDVLSASGVPIQADRGPGGGFELLAGYRTRLTGLAADEAQALLMIGLPGPAQALGLGQAAKRARRKVLAALPPAYGEMASRTGARFHLDPVDWYRQPAEQAHLPALTRAILDQRRVTMRYESWTATRDWRIDPLGLVLKGGGWYLVGRGSGKTSIFNVAKMHSLTVSEQLFERPDDFSLPEFWAGAVERFESTLRPLKAVLRVTPTGLNRISDLGAYAARAAAEARRESEPDRRGRLEVHIPLESVERGALVVLSLGSECEVIAPPELRRMVADIARRIAKQHAVESRP